MSEFLYLLVELDALLDTRLGTIHRIDPDRATQTLRNEDYYFRLKDDFTDICGIGQEEFAAAYAQRDLETIQNSVICPAAVTLKDIVIGLEVDHSDHPLAKKPVVDLNIWPYELDADTIRYLRAAVSSYAGVETLVNAVSMAPKDVTPALIRSKYSAVFMYDFWHWLQTHMPELEKIQVPRVSFFTPSLFTGSLPTPEEMVEMGLPGELDPLRAVEMSLSPYLGLDIMPTFMYCIYRPDRQQQWMEDAYRKITPAADRHPFIRQEEQLRAALARDGTIPIPPAPET